MGKISLYGLGIFLVFCGLFGIVEREFPNEVKGIVESVKETIPEVITEAKQNIGRTESAEAATSSVFVYNFNATGTLKEAGTESGSTSPYWWVNSGAKLVMSNGTGKTIQGDLPIADYFYNLYLAMNPRDSDLGLHPQNTFRLVSKPLWQNASVEAQFRITKDNLSPSEYRNASNGLLLMNRYQSSNTLYYAGLRVDGAAVIKKKQDGTYYTMGYQKILSGTYDRILNPNLIPKNRWIGLKTITQNNLDGTLTISLYVDYDRANTWQKILEVTDTGSNFGGTPISAPGKAGIRTDFMDVEFEDFRVTGSN